MNHTVGFEYVPRNYAHTHFYDYVESFPNLKVGEGMESDQKKLLAQLRHQYLTEDQSENKICLRNCFKRDQKDQVELCLKHNCNDVSFYQAASILGYLKQPKQN